MVISQFATLNNVFFFDFQALFHVDQGPDPDIPLSDLKNSYHVPVWK